MELHWITSSLSFSNGNCVQIAWDKTDSMILMRDSKAPEGTQLRFTLAEWRAFADGILKGDFDGVCDQR